MASYRLFIGLTAWAVSLSVSQLNYAANCVIAGDGEKGDIVLEVNGEQEAEPFGFKDDCSEVELIESPVPVTVIYKDQNGSPQQRTLQAGESLEIAHSGGLFSGLTLEKLQQILSPSVSTGSGKRLEADSTLTGFPSGEILLPSGYLSFSTYADALPGSALDFKVYQHNSSAVVFEVRAPGALIEIPATLFQNGQSYRWTLKGSEDFYDNIFRIAAAEDQQDFEQVLADSVSAAGPSGFTAAVMKAELCHQYEFFFDRDQELRRLYGSVHR